MKNCFIGAEREEASRQLREEEGKHNGFAEDVGSMDES
jgi:hypothetical protein